MKKVKCVKDEMKRIAENRMKAGRAGGVETIVKAISTYIDSADVCSSGCCALRNIAFTNGKS